MPQQYPASGLRLLVVDDHPETARYLRLLLARAGHDVVTAADGDVALDLARQIQPHAIISDLKLQGSTDGCDLARAVCSDGLATTPYLIAISGYDDEQHRQDAREAGYQHYLLKPIAVDQLLAILQQIQST